jgi:hypothetical protein
MLFALAFLSCSIPELPSFSDERQRFGECFHIVRSIRREVKHAPAGTEPTEAEILTKVTCTSFPDNRRNVCLALIPSQVPTIVKAIKAGDHPDLICQSLGYNRTFDRARLVERAQCEKYVGLYKTAHDSTKSEQAVPGEKLSLRLLDSLKHAGRSAIGHSALAGFQVCKEVPTGEKMLCHIVSMMAASAMREEVDQNVAPAAICTKLADKHLIKFTGEEFVKPA